MASSMYRFTAENKRWADKHCTFHCPFKRGERVKFHDFDDGEERSGIGYILGSHQKGWAAVEVEGTRGLLWGFSFSSIRRTNGLLDV